MTGSVRSWAGNLLTAVVVPLLTCSGLVGVVALDQATGEWLSELGFAVILGVVAVGTLVLMGRALAMKVWVDGDVLSVRGLLRTRRIPVASMVDVDVLPTVSSTGITWQPVVVHRRADGRTSRAGLWMLARRLPSRLMPTLAWLQMVMREGV